MRIGLPYITQIRGSEDDSLPDLEDTDPARRLGGWVAQTVTQLVAAITAGYHTEHNDDDSHSIIHATGEIYERERTTAIGDWTDVPFTATTFFASGSMTWSVSVSQQLVFAYLRIGTTLYLNYWIESSALGGTASPSLKMTLPVNLAVAQYASAATHYLNGTADVGVVKAVPGDRFVSFLKRDESNWTLASTVTLHGQLALKVSDGTGSVTVTASNPTLTYSGAAAGTVNFASSASLVLTTAGTYSITVNRAMTVTFKGAAAGAGGAGGGPNGAGTGGGGGGGGAVTTSTTLSLTTGKTYTLIVGAGGPGGASNTDGTVGGVTTFVNTTDAATLVSLAGGVKGTTAGGGAGGALVTGSNGVTGGAGGSQNVAGSAVGTGTGGGGGGGNGASGGAGGAGVVAGGAGGAIGNNGTSKSGSAGAGTGNSGGAGGAGGVTFGVAGESANGAGGGGGGGGAETVAGSGGAGGAGGDGVGVFVFVSAP